MSVDRTFRALGTEVRLITGSARAADAAERDVRAVEARLSRFDPASELCALNADHRPVVPASTLLRAAVSSALAAAQLTGGLVDPTLLGAIEAAGYRSSFHGPGVPQVPSAPVRRARPAPDAAWRRVAVLADAIARPPGVRLDLGGTGKGLAADRAAAILAPHGSFAVDCGGDLRVGGEPREVLVRHPLEDRAVATLHLEDAAVATSSVATRTWMREDGTAAHHLIDPATRRPAWTGVIAATAVAPTAVEAEARAKAALLDGIGDPWLPHGGLLVLEDGRLQRHAPGQDRRAA